MSTFKVTNYAGGKDVIFDSTHTPGQVRFRVGGKDNVIVADHVIETFNTCAADGERHILNEEEAGLSMVVAVQPKMSSMLVMTPHGGANLILSPEQTPLFLDWLRSL